MLMSVFVQNIVDMMGDYALQVAVLKKEFSKIMEGRLQQGARLTKTVIAISEGADEVYFVQGDVGSNPAQGIKSFSSNENVIQKVVRPWSPIISLQLITLRRGLDFESFVILPGGKRCGVDSRDPCN